MNRFHCALRRPRQRAFSLIELILVISLMAFIYVLVPNIGVPGDEVATKLGRLSGDIRSAYDMAVLSKRPHRLVFEFVSGKYWLEVADRKEVLLGDVRLNRDPSPRDEEEARIAFDSEFEEYQDLAGDIVQDLENDSEIPPTSPVVKAKRRLAPPKWTQINNLEWRPRDIGPNLLITEVFAEHHTDPQTLESLGEDALAMIYFFPKGYVEKAYIIVGMRKSEFELDEDRIYTVITSPFEGVARVEAGRTEVDVHGERDRS